MKFRKRYFYFDWKNTFKLPYGSKILDIKIHGDNTFTIYYMETEKNGDWDLYKAIFKRIDMDFKDYTTNYLFRSNGEWGLFIKKEKSRINLNKSPNDTTKSDENYSMNNFVA